MKDKKTDNSPYMTPAEVAALLMVAPVTVRQWAQKGKLRAQITPGGHRRFLREDVEGFVKTFAAPDSKPEHGAPPRILIVDDDTQLRNFYRELLQNAPKTAQIETAADGFEAGIKVNSFHPDILFLDLSMPGIDGFAVCNQLKANEQTRHIRVIAMTGYASPDNVARIKAAGAECCLAKPIKNAMLLQTLGLSVSTDADD